MLYYVSLALKHPLYSKDLRIRSSAMRTGSGGGERKGFQDESEIWDEMERRKERISNLFFWFISLVFHLICNVLIQCVYVTEEFRHSLISNEASNEWILRLALSLYKFFEDSHEGEELSIFHSIFVHDKAGQTKNQQFFSDLLLRTKVAGLTATSHSWAAICSKKH